MASTPNPSIEGTTTGKPVSAAQRAVVRLRSRRPSLALTRFSDTIRVDKGA